MPHERRLFLLAFVALLSAVVGLAGLAAGHQDEEPAFLLSSSAGLVAGLALLALRGRPADDASRLAHALLGLVAAVALSLPAVWTFAYLVSTPEDDSTGCGSISSPNTFLQPGGREFVLTPTCATRLREQKFYFAVLAAPSAVIAALSLSAGLGRFGPKPADTRQGR